MQTEAQNVENVSLEINSTDVGRAEPGPVLYDFDLFPKFYTLFAYVGFLEYFGKRIVASFCGYSFTCLSVTSSRFSYAVVNKLFHRFKIYYF